MNTVEASSESSSSSPSPSAGQMLRAAREKRGMHLAMLSVRLKVSVRQLEALEADQHEVFKGAAYERALALAVCRQLGVEPAPILAALPPALQSVPIDPKALEARLASVRTHARSHRGKGLSRQVLVLALLMLLGAAALIWWPSTAHHELASSPDNQDPSQVAVPMGQASDPMAFAAPAASAEQVAPAAALASDSTPSKPLAQASAPQVQAAPAGTRAPQASAPLATASAAQPNATLLISLKADAWVEVRDSRGQTLIKRTVKAGETLPFSPTAPLFVYVSKADATVVRWQGQALDLAAYTQNNEARFPIKP